jgi:hypothetical protein
LVKISLCSNGNPQRVDVAVLYPSNRGNTVLKEGKEEREKQQES